MEGERCRVRRTPSFFRSTPHLSRDYYPLLLSFVLLGVFAFFCIHTGCRVVVATKYPMIIIPMAKTTVKMDG